MRYKRITQSIMKELREELEKTNKVYTESLKGESEMEKEYMRGKADALYELLLSTIDIVERERERGKR